MKAGKALLSAILLCLASGAFAENKAPDVTVKWEAHPSRTASDHGSITFRGEVAPGWHIYSLKDDSPYPPSVTFKDKLSDGGSRMMFGDSSTQDGIEVFSGEVFFTASVKLPPESATIDGYIEWQACSDRICAMPEEWEFSVTFPAEGEENPPAPWDIPGEAGNDNAQAGNGEIVVGSNAAESGSEGLWALILEAILWGLAMLLTPCVFPMVPMTVSFFLKGSASPRAGRFKAFMYGLFIVLLYTVPISVIVLLTRIIGGDAVTADIFNWLATHWLPNIIFFLVFMVFAASFFGAFEITLPSSIVNRSDKKSDKGGLAGVFFMALTLVLVSFSCTGPIVGTVLIKSTQGQFWVPMVTMLAFSVAFALPFTLFALFPTLLKKLRSGSWMNSVKVVLGFIEIALGFKFLSTADQAYGWGLLDREVYLAIWIVTFSLLGLYLLGKIRFKNDSPVEHIGVFRLGLAITVFSFVVYMIPGMWGAPLKALSGYLPPIETQDFVIGAYAPQGTTQAPNEYGDKYGLTLPHGLNGWFTLEEGMAASKAEGKPIFLDITGKACTNCREMESRVWSDPEVLRRLRDDFVIVALYVDIHKEVPPEEQVTLESGKVLTELGSINARLVKDRYGVNAQPNYIILDSEGNPISPVRGYSLNIKGFVSFLDEGLRAFQQK